jgi:ATP-dependent helicase/nuclease subunit B
MRLEAGLLLPERQVGLAAHDFQQAACAPEVVLHPRARDAEAETVPSRWLNRLQNLLAGLPAQGGPAALAGDARARAPSGSTSPRATGPARGAARGAARHPRPAPRPPSPRARANCRSPAIKDLIRDPYTIYARPCAAAAAAGPAAPLPDALLRGTVLHKVVDRFVREPSARAAPPPAPACWRHGRRGAGRGGALARRAARSGGAAGPRGRLVSDWRGRAPRHARPDRGARRGDLAGPGLHIDRPARPDRPLPDGSAGDLDYKTGAPPTAKASRRHFDKQLLLEAAMAERGAFAGLGPAPVAGVAFIGLGTRRIELRCRGRRRSAGRPPEELGRLLHRYLLPEQGFTARRAPKRDSDRSDYDQLARWGNGTVTDPPRPRTCRPVWAR